MPAIHTAPPCSFTAGDTITFTASGSSYPATLWYMDYVVSRLGQNLFTQRATASGTDYSFTVSGTTSNVTPGAANWALVATNISTGAREVACSGVVAVVFNPTADLPATDNQTLLSAINAAILALANNKNHKVDINGQMFERHNINELYKLRDRVQAQVWEELRDMGIQAPGGPKRIQTRFTTY